MSLPRFFYADSLQSQARILLPKELAHYMQRVLRLTDQSPVVLFNGQGGEYHATLEYEGKLVYAHIGAHHAIERELPWAISVAQGLATGDKMDWICEKAVEMGVAQLFPIAARYSTLKLVGERQEKRLQHWQRIAQAASEQCGRNQIMPVHPVLTLSQLIQQHSTKAQFIFCDPDAKDDFPTVLEQAAQSNTHHWVLLIGPEGGWSEEEKEIALEAGAMGMRFGSRVLRTETAAIALVGAIRGQLGWTD